MRDYIRKTVANDPKVIEDALKFIQTTEASLNAAARQFGVPETTLRRHKTAMKTGIELSNRGGQPSLPTYLEIEIAQLARIASSHGFGLSKEELCNFIREYVKLNYDSDTQLGQYLRTHCRFRNCIPSSEWLNSFMTTYHLSLKKPATIERLRSEIAADPFVIYGFYDILGVEMERLSLIESPSHVWNLDETAFFTDPRGVKATSAIGDKAYRITSGCGRSCFTALACVSAAGAVLPPLVIFEGKNLHSTWKGEKALPGTTYACSANGWMNTDIFLAWFQNFLRHVKERPLIVILDGHSTHINLRVIKEARDANVSLIKLPSHSTNLLQPLDVSCFRSLKLLWDKQLISFQRLHNFRNISK